MADTGLLYGETPGKMGIPVAGGDSCQWEIEIDDFTVYN